MPYAATHILIPLILADIYRDYFSKVKFNLHYVLIAGLSGLLPDIDVVIFWIMNLFRDTALSEVHRTFTHTLFFPLIFFILFFVVKDVSFKKLRLNYIFLAIGFGISIHLILDGLLSDGIRPFYPLSNYVLDLSLIPLNWFKGTFFTGLDAILLVIWLVHEEWNHRISDYI